MENMAIKAEGLTKRFHARVKQEGLKASFAALVKAEYRDVTAVRDISLQVERGEVLAFIGPNGAGKSTTIKMLTGILAPTGGTVSVLGMSPSRERQKLAYRIGTVFGQKSQLWFHLPPVDSFALLGAVYDMTKKEIAQRVGELSERFDIGDLLTTPVRKLSLGQRIRCEVAASLLHGPEMLFLDEPTIGLDVVVKHKIRELIAQVNRENNVTVFLTSHDAGDVEQLCRRAIVIDHGQLVLDQPVKTLKYDYLNTKVVQVKFFAPTQPPELEGVVVEKASEMAARLVVDTKKRPIGDVVQWLSHSGSVADITVEDPPMEDIIAAIFQRQAGGAQT